MSQQWPPYDIVEYDEGRKVLVSVDMPGMEDSEFSVEFDDENIMIKGERVRPESTKKDLTVIEDYRHFGPIDVTIKLQEGMRIDRKTVKAAYHNGVLMIKLRKPEEAKEKSIRIMF